MLELRDVTYTYPGASTPALVNVSLTVAPGKRVVLMGPNGSGKSTVAALCNGLVLVGEGEVLVDGMVVTPETTSMAARAVGVVRQDPYSQLLEPTVSYEVAFGPRALGLTAEKVAERVDEALENCGIMHLKDRPLKELSGGQRQLCALAGVLAMHPRYLVLDEAGAHLDKAGRAALYHCIDKALSLGLGVLQITHDYLQADGSDELVLLGDGRVLKPADLPSTPAPATQRYIPKPPADLPSLSALSVRDVSFAYDSESAPVFENLSFEVLAGELVLVEGASGSGKSTLARVLAGLLTPTSGTVTAYGEPVRPGQVGYVMQRAEDQLFASTVWEDVAYGPRNEGMGESLIAERVPAALQTLYVPERHWQDSPFTLSGGIRRRVALAGVSALRPGAYVLDEPSAGLDVDGKRALHELVARILADGAALIVVTHDPAEWEGLASRTLRLDEEDAEEPAGEQEAADAAATVAPSPKALPDAPRAARGGPKILDPRATMAAALILTAPLFLVRSVTAVGFIAACALLMAFFAHVHARDVKTMLRPAAVLALTVFLFNALVVDGSCDIVFFGPVGLSTAGMARGGASALRIATFVTLAAVVVRSMGRASVASLAEAVVAPLTIFGSRTDGAELAVSIAVRMIPETMLEFMRISDAQRSRAGHLDDGPMLQRLKAYAAVMVPLVIKVMVRSEELAEAMRARCFTGTLTKIEGKLQPQDRFLIMLCLAVAIAVVVLLH